MQPILAESVPHRGRAVALAVVFTLFASLAALAATSRQVRSHGRHHLRHGMCPHPAYVYVSIPR
jgi:hypothetical protein